VPPVWVHFGLSLAACVAVGAASRRLPGRPALPWLGYGLVLGAVVPDTDLILSSLATAAAGFDTEVGKDLHRTFTHSLLTVGLLLAAGGATWARWPRAGPVLVGSGIGLAFLHMLPDLFYLVPLQPWWPASMEEVGPLGPVNKHHFTDAQNNAINGIDFLGESLSMLAVWLLARRFAARTRFTEALPYLAVANAVVFVALMAFVAPSATYDGFLIWAYAAGFATLVVVTALIPWKGRVVFLALAGQPPPPAAGAPPGAAPTQGPRSA
jgi:membrane-bound metal-dependent hydrolase YbcI (DUF457 family)